MLLKVSLLLGFDGWIVEKFAISMLWKRKPQKSINTRIDIDAILLREDSHFRELALLMQQEPQVSSELQESWNRWLAIREEAREAYNLNYRRYKDYSLASQRFISGTYKHISWILIFIVLANLGTLCIIIFGN